VFLSEGGGELSSPVRYHKWGSEARSHCTILHVRGGEM